MSATTQDQFAHADIQGSSSEQGPRIQPSPTYHHNQSSISEMMTSASHVAQGGPKDIWSDCNLDELGFGRNAWTATVFHSFLSFVICNVDRINLSVAIIPMASEFKWSQSTKGVVQAAFFCGYLSTGILGGRLADKIGGRRVLAGGVFGWSCMTGLTPLAAHTSFSCLLFVRILLGVCEGVAMPAMNALVKSWVPSVYISRSLGIIYSGMYMGSIIGLLITPAIIEALNWEAVFYICGISGILWVFIFLSTTNEAISSRSRSRALIATMPSTHAAFQSVRSYTALPADGNGYEDVGNTSSGNISRELPILDPEVEPNTDEAPGQEPGSSFVLPTLRKIFSYKAVWAIIIAHFCVTWGYFVLLTWLPSYFSAKYKLDISQSALFSVFPWVVMFFATHIAGVVADYMIERRLSVTRVRKIMQTVGFLSPASCLVLLMKARSKFVAVAYITIGLGLASFSHGGVYCVHQDIAGTCAGTLLGISNTFASIPGIVGVGITGIILDQMGGKWTLVFGLAVLFYLAGFVVFCAWGSSRRIFK